MAYSVLITNAIAAQKVDSFYKSAKYDSAALESGNVVVLGDLSDERDEADVYEASLPATASLATDTFYVVDKASDPALDDDYRGIVSDPRESRVATGEIFDCFLPKYGDEITLSEDGIAGSKASNTYVIPADGTGELTWSSDASSTSLVYELVETTQIEVPGQAFYESKPTAYKFRCIVGY